MATIPPKKSTTPSHSRRPSTNPANSTSSSTSNSTPNRSPSRMAPSATATATGTGSATNGINRTRSVRSGVAPPSARAAARKPATAAKDDSAAEAADAKAEMNAKLEELQEQLRLAEESVQDQQKQNAVLQVKLDEALKEQGILDERVHEQSERTEELENEKKESLRARRELEQIYENERASFMKEREETTTREEELQASVQRMKEALAQREMRAGLDDDRKPSISRNSSFRRSMDFRGGDQSPGHDFAPSSIQRSDSRSSSRLVMQKDKIIEGLRLELAEAQIKLVEMENMGGGRLQELERTMYDVKVQNARLMEENESFQLLLSEKTLNGDFSHSEFLRPMSAGGNASLNAASRPTSRHANTQGNTLADELGSQIDESEISIMGGAGDDAARKSQAEISSLRDQNKALTLYINNIISRLLQHEQFEQILDKTPDIMSGPTMPPTRAQPPANMDKDLPPPPPPKDQSNQAQETEQQQPMGFLQRARSVVSRPRPRPLSQAASDQQVQQHLQLPNKHENPATAPKIPLGRSQSGRGGPGGHRRANSEWAAGVVGSMYRGPAAGAGGPLSPGLGSPRERNSFFGPSAPLSIGGGSAIAGNRVPSGSAAALPTAVAEKENSNANATGPLPPPQQQPQRDSKGSATASSNRNSVQSATTATSGPTTTSNDPSTDAGAELSAPTSPPRSVTSSGDRESRAAGAGGSGAIMMGSKMRPLRLVQEAAEHDEQLTRKQANRGSWFGWMNKGVSGGGEGGQ